MISRSQKLVFVFLFVLIEWLIQSRTRLSGWGSANSGFSFGLGQNLLPGASYLVLAGLLLVWLLWRKIDQVGWWLIVAGGIANGISRLIWGQVWDYFHWNSLFSLWFNLADISITLGVILALWSI